MQKYGIIKTQSIKRLTIEEREQINLQINEGNSKGDISDTTPISERPIEAHAHLIPGDWEGDLIKEKTIKVTLGLLSKEPPACLFSYL